MRYNFIAGSPGGISNRIKTLVSMQRLADKFNTNYLVYWRKNWACNANFSDLFSTKINEISREKLRKIIKSRDFERYSDDENLLKKSKKKWIFFSGWRLVLLRGELNKHFSRNPLFKDGRNIDYEFEKIPLKMQKEFKKYFEKIKPSSKIQKEINLFSKEHDLEKFVGIHIRRGDFLESAKVSTDDKFIKRIYEILYQNQNQKFFLSTDSKEVETKLKRMFGNKIVSFKKSEFKRDDERFVQEGIIDLFLLSKTNYLLGSYLSSFTEVSWWLGGCKSKVEIIATEEEKLQTAKNREKLKRNMKNRIKKIIYSFVIPLDKRLLKTK